MIPREESQLLEVLVRYWWLMAIRGFIFVIYGSLVFLWPEMSTLIPLILFAIYMITNGVLSFILSLRIRNTPIRIRTFVLPGLISLLIGLGIFALPGLSALALIGAVGFWSAIVGLIEMSMAIQFREFLRHRVALFVAGGVSCVLGISVLVHPLYLFFFEFHHLALGSLFFGGLLVLLAFRLRPAQTVTT